MRLMLALILALLGAGAEAACRQALALGLDVSGSVDSGEYRMQLEGLANALEHPEVVDALLQMPEVPVRIAVWEWSGLEQERLLLDWTEITDRATLARAAATLRGTGRAFDAGATALGQAMRFGSALLAGQNGCWRRTIDISGDGKANMGPRPQDVRPTLPPGITLNALVIGADSRGEQDRRMTEIGELVSYFRAYVILGPDAFVETALGFAEYEAAMVRKLKRELQGLVIGALPQGGATGRAERGRP